MVGSYDLSFVDVEETSKRTMFGTENLGYCTRCGAEHYECEPDARGYTCEECEKPAVYGFEELLLMGKLS